MNARDVQWRLEAQRGAETEEHELRRSRSSAEALGIVPGTERIVAPSDGTYRIPTFLRKTASAEAIDELELIFSELRRINEEHEGETTKVVEAYISVTGIHLSLIQEIKDWCLRYFSLRMTKPSVRDQGCPDLRLDRLLKEYYSIFGEIGDRPNSIDYLYLAECTDFIQWTLGVWSNQSVFEPIDINTLPVRLVMSPERIESYFDAIQTKRKSYADYLCWFAELVDARRTDCLGRFATMKDAALVQFIESCAESIQQMRPFLLRNFSFEKTSIQIGVDSDVWLAWDWTMEYGIANVLVASQRERIVSDARTGSGTTKLAIKVSHNGLLVDGTKPWITAHNERRLKGVNLLALNAVVIEQFHDRLFSFYEKIDFDRIRHRSTAYSTATDELPEEAEEEIFELSVRDLVESTTPSTEKASRSSGEKFQRLQGLRFQKLIQILDSLGAEVQQSKGSEVSVFRAGGHKYTLGRHVRNREVYPTTIRRMLRTVGISIQEWLTAVYRRS